MARQTEFDPKAYLTEDETPAPQGAAFDPKAYLAEPDEPASLEKQGQISNNTFDPAAYLSAPDGQEPEVTPSSGSTGQQVARGALLGVKKALNPWDVAPDEFNRKQTWTEAVADTLANVATGMGTGAAIGAGLGSVIPGFGTLAGGAGGALLYGLYAGLGNEYMRSKAVGQDFDPARAGLQVALEANPLLKSAGKLVTIGRVAAQAAGQAAAEYSYTKDPTAAAFAGSLGLLTGPLLYRGMRADAKLPSVAAAQATMDALRRGEREGVTGRTATKVGELWRTGVMDAVDAADPEFQRYVLRASPDAAQRDVARQFNEFTSKLSPERVKEAWQLYKTQGALADAAADFTNEGLRELGAKGLPRETTTAIGRKLKDARFIANDADEIVGTNLTGALDDLSRALDQHATVASGFVNWARQAKRATDALGLSLDDVGKALAGKTDEASPKAQQLLKSGVADRALKAWRTAFDGVHRELRAQGYGAGYLEDYLPMKALRGAELASAVEQRIDELQRTAAKQGGGLFDLKGTDEFKELSDIAVQYLGKPLHDAADIEALSGAILKGAAKEGVGYRPSALFTRRGELPSWSRQYNVGAAFADYVNGNLKAVFLDPALRRIEGQVAALRAAGLNQSADYFQRVLENASGVASDKSLVQAQRQFGEALRLRGRRLMRTAPTAAGRTLGKALDAAPDFASWATSLVYPAFLGGNVRAVLRNLTQNYATTAPEIGGAYGYGLVNKALGDTARVARKGLGALEDELRTKNQLAGIVKSGVLIDPATFGSRGRELVDLANEVLMSVYSKTDLINRHVSLGVGRRWADDVLAGKAPAIKALRNIQRGPREQLLAGLRDKTLSRDQLADVLGDYLISKTQFRYGREQLHEFGRDAGPLFSMFTKWPAMIGSDIVDTLKHRPVKEALGRLTGKYLAPFAALAAADAAIEQQTQLEKNPKYKYLVGNTKSLSPLMSTFEYDVAGGPAVRGVIEGLGSVGRVLKGEAKAGDVGKDFARGLIKTTLPPASAVLNELDRWRKANEKTPVTQQALDDFGKTVGRAVDRARRHAKD